MEQQIRFCKTSDGIDIAYTTHGDGPALVISPNILVSHLQVEMNRLQTRAFYERLSRRVRVVRYDRRGTGMSQRDVADFSAEAGQRDLLAVVDRLGLDRFSLYTHVVAGEAPLAFAASHPERITSLIWWVGVSEGFNRDVQRQFDAIAPLMDTEWELYTNIAGRLLFGWNSPEATQYAELARAGTTPAVRRAANEESLQSWTARYASAADISVPTLVAHPADSQLSARAARTIAASIPPSHVIAVPGGGLRLATFVAGESEVLIAAIADFVEATAGDSTAPVRAPELQLGAMRAILFTDIVGHTEMMQRLGDARGRDVLREHERITRETLAAHGGSEVKAMGDGFMAWFSSAHQAVGCSIALQRAFAAHNDGGAEQLLMRTGINAGEPIIEDDDLFGTSVIAASRICAQAAGGEIVVSDVVRQLVAGKGYVFSDRGEFVPKGFDEGVRLWDVRWEE